jgi:copper chaperone CopZ
MSTTTTTHTVLRAEGFSCPSCVSTIEKHVGRVAGVSAVSVQYASGRIEVDHDPAAVGVDTLVAAVAKAGYVARPATF